MTAPSTAPARPALSVARAFSARQEEILEALEPMFLQRGFRALSVGELAAAAKCSRSTLYEIAPSKEELFLIVLDRGLTRIDAAGRAVGAHLDDAGERIEAYFQLNLTALSETGPDFARDATGYLPSLRILNDHAYRGHEYLGALIDEGIAEGRFRNVDSRMIAALMTVTLQRIAEPEVEAMLGRPWTEALSALIDLVLHGLLGPQVKPAEKRSGRKAR